MAVKIEGIFLLIVFSVMMWAGCGVLWDYKISHEFPFGYMASDTFQHQTRIEGIKEQGNYKYEPFYIVSGFRDVIGYYPPLLYHLGIIFSYTSGLETYDGAYFLIFFLTSIAALITYLIIKEFNKWIAILSVPLSVLVFSKALYAGFTWGHWPSLAAQVFLVALFWVVMKMDMKSSYILLGIILSGIIMTHTSEIIFGIIFITIFFSYRFFTKSLKWYHIKTVVLGGLISFIACLYYLIIFKSTWMKMQAFKFGIKTTFGGTISFFMKDFGWILLILMGIGLVVSLMLLIKKKINTAILVGFVMLLVGYGNYYGLGIRAFQARFLWPIYLSIFFGLGVYQIIKFFTKKSNLFYGVALVFLLIFNINTISAIPSTARFTSQGMMDEYHWDTLNWLKENTPIDSKLYFFYGDIYYQDALLRNAQREHYLVDRTDFINSLQNRTIKRNYLTRAASDSATGFPYRTGLFTFGLHTEDWTRIKERDICDYDYYILDRATAQPILAQYNLLIGQKLLVEGYVTEVFRNEVAFILKNNRPGGDCIAEQTFG